MEGTHSGEIRYFVELGGVSDEETRELVSVMSSSNGIRQETGRVTYPVVMSSVKAR